MEFGSDSSPPSHFRYTFEDNLGKGNDQRQAREPNSKMELGRDPSQSNQFRYTFEDNLEEEMTSSKHASQTSKMEFERDPSTPYQFRYTFEDDLEEENDQRQSREPKIEIGAGAGRPVKTVSVHVWRDT